MKKEYKWYAVVSPRETTSVNAFTSEEANYLKSIGYTLNEVVSLYFKTK